MPAAVWSRYSTQVLLARMKGVIRSALLLSLALGQYGCAPAVHEATPKLTPTIASTATPTAAPYPAALNPRAVFAYYFYWYDEQTGAHLAPYGEVPAVSLTDHPTGTPAPSWRSPAWHLEQLKDMVAAGIDVMLPVYWPGDADWARGGLGPLAEALEDLRRSGSTPPAVGMFYDTTRLRGVDLRTIKARDDVYDDIHYFFSTIPRGYWALAEGSRPVIWFYSGNFPAEYDRRFFNDIHSRFEKDFGLRPFLVMDEDWNCQKLPHEGQGYCDATYIWGGAFSPTFSPTVASIGPGYDERGLPDRSNGTHIARLGGTTYLNGLAMAMKCGQPWLAIETWNEYHEGTDIAASLEYGRTYVELSRQVTDIFKSGLRPLELRIRTAFSHARSVAFLAGSSLEHGITLVPGSAEKPFGSAILDGLAAITVAAPAAGGEATSLAFQVDDGFYFAEPRSVVLRVDFFDEGKGSIVLQYDASPCGAGSDNSDFAQVVLAQGEGSNTWRSAEIPLRDATFASRGSAPDFRLVTEKTDLAVHLVRLAEAPPLEP